MRRYDGRCRDIAFCQLACNRLAVGVIAVGQIGQVAFNRLQICFLNSTATCQGLAGNQYRSIYIDTGGDVNAPATYIRAAYTDGCIA